MGLDVRAYVVVDAPLDETAINAANEATGLLLCNALVYHGDEELHVVEWDTIERFYHPGYERGRWSLIRDALMALRDAFPGHVVHYHSDCHDGPLPMTTERMAALDAHHQGVNGDAYHVNSVRHPWTEPTS